LARLEQQLRENPRSTVYAEVADAYLRAGRPADAVEVCHRGLVHHAEHVPGRLALARALVTQGQHKEAQAELLKVVKLDRQCNEAFILLGEVLMHRGDYERAGAILAHAHELDPDDANVMDLLKRARDRVPPPATPAPGAHPDVQDDESDSDLITIVQDDKKPVAPPPPKPVAAAKAPPPPAAKSPAPKVPPPTPSKNPPPKNASGPVAKSPVPVPKNTSGPVPAAVRSATGSMAAAPKSSTGASPTPKKKAAFEEEPTKVADDDYVAEQMKKIESAWEKELDASTEIPRAVAGAPLSTSGEFDEDAPTRQATPAAAAEFAHELTTRKAAPPAQLVAAATPPRRKTDGALPGVAAGPPAVPAISVEPTTPDRPDGTVEVISRDVVEEATTPGRSRATEDSFGATPTKTVDKSRGFAAPPPSTEPSIRIEDDEEGIPQMLKAPQPERVEFGGREPPMPRESPHAREPSSPRMPYPPAPSAPMHAEAAFRAAAIGMTPARGKASQHTTKLPPEERPEAIPQPPARTGSQPPRNAPQLTSDPVLNAILGGGQLDFPGVERRVTPKDPTLTTREEQAFNLRRGRSFLMLWIGLIAIAVGAGSAGFYTWYQRTHEAAARYQDAVEKIRLGGWDSYQKAREDYVAIIKLDSKDDKAACELAATHALVMLDYGEDEGIVATMNRRAEQQLEKHHNQNPPAACAVAQAALNIRRGELDKARDTIVKAVASHADEARLPYVAALARVSTGEDKEARDLLQDAIKKDARYVPALVALGNLYSDTGDFDRADEAYRKALAIAPEHPRAVLGRALLRIDRGQDLDRAVADLNVTLQKWADQSPPMAAWRKLGLGELHIRLGDAEKAAQDLDAAQKGNMEDGRFQVRLARARLDQGKISDAERLLRKVAQRRARDPQIETLDAEIALAKGFEDRVVAALTGKQGGPPRSRIALGRAYYATGKQREAAEVLESALKDLPEDTTALVYRALVRAASGDGQVADRELEKLARASASTLPRYALGKLAMDKGDLERARTHLEAACTGNPETYRAALLLARIHEKKNRTGEAIKALEKAVSDNASFVPAHVELGRLDVEVGRWRAGRTELKAAVELGKADGELLLALARAQAELGFTDDVQKTLSQASEKGASSQKIEQLRAVAASWDANAAPAAAKKLEAMRKGAPRDVRLLVDIGTAWRRAGMAKPAEQAFDTALKIDADSVDARLGMAKLRLLAGDGPRAVAAYSAAETSYRKRSYLAQEKLVEAKVGIGRAYLLPGAEHASDKARKAFEEAVATDPEDPEAQYYLGRLYLDIKETGRAKDALARAVELDPQFADAHYYLAEAIRENDHGRAKRAYEKYCELAPKGEHFKAAKKALESLQ
jgi:tetratricopeptide (TPR) repeat protein